MTIDQIIDAQKQEGMPPSADSMFIGIRPLNQPLAPLGHKRRGHHRLKPTIFMAHGSAKVKKDCLKVPRDEVNAKMALGWWPVKRSVYRSLE